MLHATNALIAPLATTTTEHFGRPPLLRLCDAAFPLLLPCLCARYRNQANYVAVVDKHNLSNSTYSFFGWEQPDT